MAAQAQDVPAAPMPGDPATSPERVPALTSAEAPGDIVVTAQRREQRLNDVGIAVSVLGEKALQNYNITSATDIVRAIPNLKFNAYGSSQVVFNIRGVSQNDFGDQQEPPVAVYQDDSYSSSITSASFPTFDLSRVEALRGPQGTLFGRNATGGAVQFLSNQPSDHLEGYVSGTYGSFNQSIIEGAVSGPITNSMTARIAGQYDRDDGYIRNITPGQPDRGANNHWALRGILKFDPGGDFKAKLTLRYAEADHERQAGNYTFGPACPNAQFQGEYLAVGQSCAYWGTVGSSANGYSNPSITPSQGGNPWRTAGTGDAFVDRKQFGASLRLDGKLGGFDITSITDYQHLDKLYREIGDGDPEQPYTGLGSASNPTPYPCLANAPDVLCYASGTYFFQKAVTNQYTQEIRASTSFGRQYLVFGAFGMMLDGKFNAKYATPFNGYDPDVAFTQKTRSWAIFAQDEWKINDKLKLIGGLRYWHDHKIGDYAGVQTLPQWAVSLRFGPNGVSYSDTSQTGPYNPGPAPFNNPASWSFGSGVASGVTITPEAATPDYSGLTARLELDYKPSPDTLIYASYNRGSKSGGFTFSTGTPYPSQLVDTLNNLTYRPETLNDYELGLKAKIGSNTQLNLSAFYYDYKNYQAFVQVFSVQVVRNLPATVKGIEAELTTKPLPGLTLQFSGALQDSKVKDILLPDGVTRENHSLPQAPSLSGNALVRYEFDLAGGQASVQADALYSGKSCFTVLCAPVEREPAYHVENARIGFTPKNSNLDLALFVNNMFDRAYRVYALDASLYWGTAAQVYAKPRTWGINARWHFGG